ncbi:MAG TPA: hypothetical protein VHM70_30910 [Polyangiaceae bacterium]|jgi:hypothetical protein|nr:hypothetical protein [Polyangiaceae bacterium]
MINGAHVIIYSRDAEADRAFLRDLIELEHVDVGGGWLIFALPPSEVAIHPGDDNDVHELYLTCPDVEAFVEQLGAQNIACGEIQDLGWGRLTKVTLPGGGTLGVYEPRHERPPSASAKKSAHAKKSAKKKTAKATTTRKPATKPATSAKKTAKPAAKGSRAKKAKARSARAAR